MALLWCDGFDAYGPNSTNSAPGLSGRYQVSGSPGIVDGRYGGHALLINASEWAICQLPSLKSELIVGFGYKNTQIGNRAIVQFNNGSTVQGRLFITNTERLQYRFGTGTSVLAENTGFALPIDAWAHIEFRIVFSNTSGSVELRVDGNVIWSETGLDTVNGTTEDADRVYLTGAANTTSHFDDYYILDTTGGSLNTWLGNRRVYTIHPNGNGDTNDFSEFGADTNYECVNEQTPDDDSTYVHTDDPDQVELYNYGSLFGTVNVNAVCVNSRMRASGTNNYNVQHIAQSGLEADHGPTEAITSTDWTTRQSIFTVDPDTNEPWTPAGVNNAQFGIRTV